MFTTAELTEEFSLEKISGGNAVFNVEKLEWFNHQYIQQMPVDELARRLRFSLDQAGLWDAAYLAGRKEWFAAVIELLRPRAKRLGDFAVQGRIFFADEVEYDPQAVRKHLVGMREHLGALDNALAALTSFDPSSIEAALRALADVRGVKAASLIHAARVAVTGKTASPGLFEVLALLGRMRVHRRLLDAAQLASTHAG
jgi:glutamyl-tRNA synthetase